MGEDQIEKLQSGLNKINDRLTSIEIKLEERCEPRDARLTKVEKEVTNLRLAQATVVGGAALLSVVMGYILKGLGLE